MPESFNANPFAPPSAAADFQQLNSGSTILPHRLSPPSKRLAGATLDGLFHLFSLIPAIIVAIVEKGKIEESPTFWLIFSVCFLAFSSCQWYLISTRGQSIGKRMLGMKIVRIDGQPVGFVHGVLMRSWITAALGCVPIIGSLITLIDPLMIFYRGEHRTLHDHIAGTLVIEV